VLPFYNWFWLEKIRTFVRKNQIGALHIHDLPLVGAGLKIKKENGIPLIADMHENYPVFISEIKFANTLVGKLLISKNKWFQKEKKWLQHADRIVTVANGMKKRLDKRLGSGHNIIVVQNTPLAEQVLAEQEDVPNLEKKFIGKFIVFYFGGLDSRRGLITVIEAVNQIKTKISNILVVIAGAGSYKYDLEQKIRDLNLEKYVSFEGWQSVNHLKAYLDLTSITVIPHFKSSQTDNSSPNKLYLYMLFGKAVVVSNCQSIQEIVDKEGCGLIYESGNGEELAEKIFILNQNPEQANEMGQAGRKAVLEKYDWSVTVNELIMLYEEIAE